MMYLFDFFRFLFDILVTGLKFLYNILLILLDIVEALFTLVGAFPVWLSVPFIVLLAIAILFRVSQFIPTIGGAK